MRETSIISGKGTAYENGRAIGPGRFETNMIHGVAGGGMPGRFDFDEGSGASSHGADQIRTDAGDEFSIIVVDVSDEGFRFLVCGLVELSG